MRAREWRWQEDGPQTGEPPLTDRQKIEAEIESLDYGAVFDALARLIRERCR